MKVMWNILIIINLLELRTTAESSTTSDLSVLIEEMSKMKYQIGQNQEMCNNKLVAMETRLQEVEEKLQEAEKTIETFRNNNDLRPSLTKRQSSAHRVAFTAFLSAHSNNNKIIPFDSILLNQGGAFSRTTHQFICPVYGTYVFQSAVMADRTTMVQTEIVKNGVGLVTQYAAGSTGSHGFDQGFNSVVIQCSIGDRIWVQIYGDYGTTVYASRYSTFSGFLLWEM